MYNFTGKNWNDNHVKGWASAKKLLLISVKFKGLQKASVGYLLLTIIVRKDQVILKLYKYPDPSNLDPRICRHGLNTAI